MILLEHQYFTRKWVTTDAYDGHRIIPTPKRLEGQSIGKNVGTHIYSTINILLG